MMIASRTPASAAATVITKNTKTCPPAPYCCAKATKVRFTALSISSTHMNTMIALRRISTPNRPIRKSTPEKKSASPSMFVSALFPKNHRADDRREQQNARDLEREEVFVEKRRRDRSDRAGLRDLPSREALGKRQDRRRARLGERKDLGREPESNRAAGQFPAETARIADAAMAEVEQHDHKEEHDHDRAGVHQHLPRADEVGVEHAVERARADHRVHEPERRGHRTLPRHEEQRRHHGKQRKEIEVERVEQRQRSVRPRQFLRRLHPSPFGSAGSHISQTGCVCAISRSRS